MPFRMRRLYLPVNLDAYAFPSAAAPSKSLEIVIEGTEMLGPAKIFCLRCLYFASHQRDDVDGNNCLLSIPNCGEPSLMEGWRR
jgi:hypothetical protein